MDLDPGRSLRGTSPDGLLHHPGTTRSAGTRHSAQAPAHRYRGRKPGTRARSLLDRAGDREHSAPARLRAREHAVRHGGAGEDEVIELELGALDGGRVMVQV